MKGYLFCIGQEGLDKRPWSIGSPEASESECRRVRALPLPAVVEAAAQRLLKFRTPGPRDQNGAFPFCFSEVAVSFQIPKRPDVVRSM